MKAYSLPTPVSFAIVGVLIVVGAGAMKITGEYRKEQMTFPAGTTGFLKNPTASEQTRRAAKQRS